MSQKTRATGASSGCQGRIWNVLGSGRASTSLSWTREKPSMAEPSKVMPSSRAFSSSAGVMAKVLAVPRTSVNQSCTKRTARSSTVLSTYSCWLRMWPPLCRSSSTAASQAGADAALFQCRRPWRGRGPSSYAVHRRATAAKCRRGRLRRRPLRPVGLARGTTDLWVGEPATTMVPAPSDRPARRAEPARRRARRSDQGGTVQKRTPAEVLRLVQDEGIEIVDVRFVDLPGLMQHFSVPAHQLTEDVFEEGFGFDGSSIRGFQEIQESDMLLMPDPNTAVIDPFREHRTLNINCFVRDPVTLEPYSRDPRYVATKAEAYLGTTGLADTCYFGPEAEFFIFDDVRYSQDQRHAFYQVDSVEGHWNTGSDEGPNLGYKIRPKEGYFPVPPADHFQDLRSEMILTMERLGIEIEVQHHEVATAGQAEIDMKFDTLLVMADKLMLYKYVVKNVARAAGFTATFMPKPLFQDNGSGMHCHQSLWKDGEPALLRRGLRGAVGHGPVVHRRTAQARPGGARLRGADDQLLQAARPRLRGAREPRVLAAQPIRRLPDPAVLAEPEGQAGGVPLPRPLVQPVSGLLGHAHGRSRRGAEPHRAS